MYGLRIPINFSTVLNFSILKVGLIMNGDHDSVKVFIWQFVIEWIF